MRVDYRIVVDPDAGGLGGLATVHTPSSKLDLRGLTDRLGALGVLPRAACKGHRVAVIGSGEDDCHAFSEAEARRRGYELRRFSDMAMAIAWLDGADH